MYSRCQKYIPQELSQSIPLKPFQVWVWNGRRVISFKPANCLRQLARVEQRKTNILYIYELKRIAFDIILKVRQGAILRGLIDEFLMV